MQGCEGAVLLWQVNMELLQCAGWLVGCILSPMCIIVLTNTINIYRLCFLLALQIDFFIREGTEYCVLPMQSARYELGFNPVMAVHQIQRFTDL